MTIELTDVVWRQWELEQLQIGAELSCVLFRLLSTCSLRIILAGVLNCVEEELVEALALFLVTGGESFGLCLRASRGSCSAGVRFCILVYFWNSLRAPPASCVGFLI